MRPPKTNPRIAIFCDYFEQPFQANIVRLCLKELEARDCSAVIINGNNIARSTLYQDPGVFLFDYARDSFDGIIASGGSIASYSGAANTKTFLNRFAPTPIVNIALDLPGISTSMTDNAVGVNDIMEHLVVDHHYTKILFLSKSEGEGDGEARLDAFEESLKSFGITANPNLIVPSVFYESPSQQASYIFDQQKMVPGRDFEAIFGVDSYSISLLYPFIEKRGYSAPRDFAIAAFDLPITYDFPFRLTCSAQNFELIARNAIDALFTKIAGFDTPSSTLVRPFFVLGNSCGCLDPLSSIANIASPPNELPDKKSHPLHTVVDEIKRYLALNHEHAFKEQILRLIALFEAHSVDEGGEKPRFLEDQLLCKEIQYGVAGLIVRILKLCGPHPTLAHAHSSLFEQIKRLGSEILTIEGQFALQIHHSNSVTRNLLSASYPPGDPGAIAKMFIEALDQIGVTKSLCYLFSTETQAAVCIQNMHGLIGEKPDPTPPRSFNDSFFDGFLGSGFYIFYPLFFESRVHGILGMELPFEYWHDSVAIETLRSLLSNTLNANSLIQEKERSLRKLRETQDQLVRAEKLAILEKLVRELSHEINTPIGNTLTAAGFIKDQAQKALSNINASQVSRSQLVNHMNMIEESSNSLLAASRKMAAIINNFQMLMVNDPVQEKISFYLADFFWDIIKTIQKSNKSQRVIVNFNCNKKTRVKTHQTLLKEILVNLLYNSFHHAFEKNQTGTINITITEQSNQVEIIFSDNGRGLSTKQRPSIFEPFNHEMSSESRPGLGLYIVYSITVMKLDGTIDLIDEDQPGLSFRIRLPILDLS